MPAPPGDAGNLHDPKEIEKLIKAQQTYLKLLKKESDAYKQGEKDLKKYRKLLTAAKLEKTQLAKVAQQLTTQLTGGSGTAAAFKRISDSASGFIFKINKSTGSVSMFGKTMGMSAGKFLGYLAAIQLVIAGLGKYLDFQDKAQKRQGELMRAFGSTNVSITESFKASASGWSAAGKTGAEAAEKLIDSIYKARGTVAKELTQSGNMRYLTELTAGFSKNTPEYITTLSEVFAKRGGKDMLNTIEKIGVLAKKSGAPMEQMVNLVFDLGKEFVHLGFDIEDATRTAVVFMDAVGAGKLKPAIGINFMQQVVQEQRSAAGLQRRFMTAAFAGQNFTNLPTQTQGLLNKMAGPGGFQGADIMQQASILGKLKEGDYAAAKTGTYEILKKIEEEIGEPAATMVAPQLTGMEWRPLKEFMENVELGKITEEEAAKKWAEMSEKSKPDAAKMTDAVENFREYVKVAADRNKEWYADFAAAVTKFGGWVVQLTGETSAAKEENLYKGMARRGEITKQTTAEILSEKQLQLGRPLTQQEIHETLGEKKIAQLLFAERSGIEAETFKKYGKLPFGMSAESRMAQKEKEWGGYTPLETEITTPEGGRWVIKAYPEIDGKPTGGTTNNPIR